jgi:hypothetical protein
MLRKSLWFLIGFCAFPLLFIPILGYFPEKLGYFVVKYDSYLRLWWGS